MTAPLFFRPAQGWAGDVSPFFHDGTFHLFYLKELRDEPYDSSAELAHAPDSRLEFHHLTTEDFLAIVDHGVAVPVGSGAAPDRSLGTGSIVRAGGRFHFFFSGMNPTSATPQVQLVATSEDLFTWHKEEGFTLGPPDDLEHADFRDPFVLPSPEGQGYWMLLAGRAPEGPWHRRGLTQLFSSDDLRDWRSEGALYAPETYFTHECPDLFRIGDWWYLVFSEFSRGMQTRYRKARHPRGPYLVPEVDTFDTRACYAAKTVSDGERRVLIGWVPSRDDTGQWLWGGDLVAFELDQAADGSLVPIPLSGLAAAAGAPASPRLEPIRGRWWVSDDAAGSAPADGYRALELGRVGSRWAVRLRLSVVGSGGIVLGDDRTLDRGYEIRFERDGLAVDAFPRRGEVPPLAFRPWVGDGADHDVTVVREGEVLHVVSAGRAALTTRVTTGPEATLAAFAEHGPIEITGVELWT